MKKLARTMLLGFCFAVTSTAVFAENAMYMKLIDVGGSAPTGGDAMTIANPGDIITVEVWIRDWSPAGELNRAYQIAVPQ